MFLFLFSFFVLSLLFAGLRLERRIEEAQPAAQQLHELGLRVRYDDSSSEHVSHKIQIKNSNRKQ